MIRLIEKIPSRIYIACSGGSDSMAALDFLNNGSRDITVAYFNHGTPHGDVAETFIKEYCIKICVPIILGSSHRPKLSKESWEEYWRNMRYIFFNALPGTVITAHQLDDVCEWWVFSSLHGEPKLIPSINKNVMRPFLTTKKDTLLRWCKEKDVPYIMDPTNNEIKFRRNFIRNKIMKDIFVVNPGFHKTIFKKLIT